MIWCQQWGGTGKDNAAMGEGPSAVGTTGTKGLTFLPNDMVATTFVFDSPTVGPMANLGGTDFAIAVFYGNGSFRNYIWNGFNTNLGEFSGDMGSEMSTGKMILASYTQYAAIIVWSAFINGTTIQSWRRNDGAGPTAARVVMVTSDGYFFVAGETYDALYTSVTTVTDIFGL